MLSNLSNKKLAVIFLVLLALVVILFIGDSGKNERSFRSTLVEIDTSSVSAIKIFPKSTNHKEVNIFKEDNNWFVTLENGKNAPVTKDKIESLFNQLLEIKPKRLVARGENKWHDLQVDSVGTRVEIYEGSDKVLDLVIGKFNYQQQMRIMSSFVRLTDEEDVYEVDGFLDMTFNHDQNQFRDATIIKDDFNNWSRLSFSYPADSSFQVDKRGDSWYSNNLALDSLKAVRVLRQLSSINGNGFVDDENIDLSGNPTHKLTIDSEKLGDVVIEGFLSDDKSFIRSSLNPDAVFDGTKNKLFEKVFISQTKFFK